MRSPRSNSAAPRRARTSAVAVTKDLHVRVGKDDGSDVARHRAPRPGGAARNALKGSRSAADLGMAEHRSRLADGLVFRPLVETAGSTPRRARPRARGSSAMPHRASAFATAR
jgi:hypothetical protein